MRFGRAEVFSENAGIEMEARQRRKNLIRFLIFLVVSVVCTAASLAYVFARSPVFESVAGILITPPESEGPATGTGIGVLGVNAPDIGIVSIERYQLLATPLLSRLLELVRREYGEMKGIPGNLAELQALIRIQRFEDTNIVTLRAAGPHPEILPIIVNRWLLLYTETQSRTEHDSASDERTRLTRQEEEMRVRIDEKRSEIETFRSRHDIVSMERDENQLVARLKGLTKSLDKAVEEELIAQGHFDAVSEALRNGKPVINQQDEAAMANLERRLLELQEQIKDFEQRFTKRYIDLDTDIQAVFRQRTLVEERIVELRERASAVVLNTAEQSLAGARQTVKGLRNELASSKHRIAEFSTRFAEHQALVGELKEMEKAHAQLRTKLLRREVNTESGVTKVEVLESASQPIEPIWPHYTRDAGIAVAGSLVLGIFAVILFDFFTRSVAPTGYESGVQNLHVTNVRTDSLRTLDNGPAINKAAIGPDPPLTTLSDQSAARALTNTEICALFAAGDTETRLVIGLLLSGISIDEIVSLRCSNFDIAAGVISAFSKKPRKVTIPEVLRAGFESQLSSAAGADDPLWRDYGGGARTREDIEALIAMAARDAGLAEPDLATAENILHSYLVFLVGQGMRLADLENVVGPMAPSARGICGSFARWDGGTPRSG